MPGLDSLLGDEDGEGAHWAIGSSQAGTSFTMDTGCIAHAALIGRSGWTQRLGARVGRSGWTQHFGVRVGRKLIRLPWMPGVPLDAAMASRPASTVVSQGPVRVIAFMGDLAARRDMGSGLCLIFDPTNEIPDIPANNSVAADGVSDISDTEICLIADNVSDISKED